MKIGVKSLLCAMVLVLCVSTCAFAQFSDMPQGDDGIVIEKAVQNGLLTGFEDGTVRPSDAITRAQMAAIMVRALGASEVADISAFGDVQSDAWYYDSLAKAVAMEAFKGDGENLNPNNTITRQEALIVLSRIFDLPSADTKILETNYADGNAVSDWAREEVCKVLAAGYVPESENIRPLDAMTRLEFAQIMDRLVKVYITESGVYTNENLPEGNILIKAEGVTFNNAEIKQNVFVGDGVKGKTEFNFCKTERVIIRGGRTIVNRGEHMSVRAIGKDSALELKNLPTSLNPDGAFYAKSGKGTIYIQMDNVALE